MLPPDDLLPYLTTKGSLTALLEQKAGQPLGVQIIKESYQAIDFSTKKSLGLPLNRPALAWVREVLLFGNDKLPWVQAKSIFPLSSLQGDAKRLAHLRQTPIGYVLFKKTRTLPHTRQIFYHDGTFGRRTVYDWRGRKILVEERFLPAFYEN